MQAVQLRYASCFNPPRSPGTDINIAAIAANNSDGPDSRVEGTQHLPSARDFRLAIQHVPSARGLEVATLVTCNVHATGSHGKWQNPSARGVQGYWVARDPATALGIGQS